MADFPNTPNINQVFSDGTRAWAFDGTKWVAAGNITAGAVPVPTLVGLAAITVPATVSQVVVERYDTVSLVAPARYNRVTLDPGVPMSGADATGSWFRLAESPASPEMAGAHGDGVHDDGPAFCRLLQGGDMHIQATSGKTYKVAVDGVTKKAMHNNDVDFSAIQMDMTGARVVLDCDGGVDEYGSFLFIRGVWDRFVLRGGTWKYSTPPFLYGLVTAVGVGATPDDMWFEFRRDAGLSHPPWLDQSIRIIDKFDPATRQFDGRVAGNFNSDVTVSDSKSTAGYPITRPVASDIYRVDLRDTRTVATGRSPFPAPRTDPPTAAQIRDELVLGDLVGVQHRRDTNSAFRFGHLEHADSRLTIEDVTVYHGDTVSMAQGVAGGNINRLRFVPERAADLYSVSAGGFRLQNVRGTWTFSDCWAVACGDDGFMSYANTQRIAETPTTDVTLAANQLRLSTGVVIAKPLVGDIVQLRDWASGTVDESDTWTVTAIDNTPDEFNYVVTFDKDVNPAWTPTGVTFEAPVDPDEPPEEVVVGDGTGWALDTLSGAPQVIVHGARMERNRGTGWLVSHVGPGSHLDIDWAVENGLAAIWIGNAYPTSLVGIVPREISAHIKLVEGGFTRPAVFVGGYSGNTRALAASPDYVRDVDVTIDTVRNIPRQFIEVQGATRANLRVGTAIGYVLDPNPDAPQTNRAIYGENAAYCTFDGGAVASLSRADVLFEGNTFPGPPPVDRTSHDNVVVSPAKARNWLDNVEYRRVAKGVSVVVSGQITTFDRWLAHRTAGGATVTREAGFDGAEYCMRVLRTDSANTQIVIGQQLPGAYVRQLRGKTIIAYFTVRAGANYILIADSQLRAHLAYGTVFGEIWDMNNSSTGGLTGPPGNVTAVGAVPEIAPVLSTSYDYVTQKYVVPDDAAVLGLSLGWTPPAATAPGAADYLEFGPIALVVVGEGFDAAPPPPEEALILTGEAAFDPVSLAASVGTNTTITVTGVALGDQVEAISFSLNLQGVALSGYVSGTNNVVARFYNATGGVVDLGSGTVRVRVRRVANT